MPSSLQDLDGLGAGVVELAGLADHDRPRADHEDGLDPTCRGMAASRRVLAHHGDELLEEVVAVVGTRAGLGVVLHREHGQLAVPEALDGAVVEVDVGQLELAAARRARVDRRSRGSAR